VLPERGVQVIRNTDIQGGVLTYITVYTGNSDAGIILFHKDPVILNQRGTSVIRGIFKAIKAGSHILVNLSLARTISQPDRIAGIDHRGCIAA